MTKRESKVRAADQIVRLNPDIFGDVILRASDISLLIDTAGLILEVIYNTENKNLGDIAVSYTHLTLPTIDRV